MSDSVSTSQKHFKLSSIMQCSLLLNHYCIENQSIWRRGANPNTIHRGCLIPNQSSEFSIPHTCFDAILQEQKILKLSNIFTLKCRGFVLFSFVTHTMLLENIADAKHMMSKIILHLKIMSFSQFSLKDRQLTQLLTGSDW